LLGQVPSPAETPAVPNPRQAVNAETTSDEQVEFDEAKAADDAGTAATALSKYRRFIKKNPASPLAVQAQYRIAELYESEGDATNAFDAYQKLITQYPDTPNFEKAIGRQVLIANEFLGGKKNKIFGLEIVPGSDRAEGMFTSILKNAPYSKNAPVAQFNLALTYERQGKLKEAAAKDPRTQATVKVMPGLNHLFQPAKTGSLEEYTTIDTTMSPEVLDAIAAWVLAQPSRNLPPLPKPAPDAA
jgi:tetratricopeptide (TPR) repeat protein